MSDTPNFKGFATAAVYSGHQDQDAHLTPIFASSTFSFPSAESGMNRFEGKDKGFIYSRWGNPTFQAVEATISRLEGFGLTDNTGAPLQLKSLLHSSGQAAMATLFLSLLKTGDRLLSHLSLYGGTHELVMKVLSEAGIACDIIDMHDLAAISAAFKKHPYKVLHIETPANPTGSCVDIAAIVKIASANGCKVSADNTFATPWLQQPFAHGVDFVIHSTTKFLNGHGTSIGGVLIGKDLKLMNTKITKWHRLLGGNSNPFDAFLLMNGMKTLAVRMRQHCENAMRVAEFLNGHPQVQKVFYAGLPTHPDHLIMKKQMKHAGAVLSFELKGGTEEGKRFINKLKLCVRAVSVGTVDTLISHPASMTHYGVPKAEREMSGITDSLIRMSVGIEDVEDIIADLNQALS